MSIEQEKLEKNLLTDEELESICETLENTKSPDAAILKSAVIKANAGEELDTEDMAFVDSSGNLILTADEKFSELSLSEINSEGSVIVEKETTKNTVSNFGYSEEDTLKILEVMERVKSGEKFSVYNNLPHSVRTQLIGLTGTTDSNSLKMAAKTLINQFISETQRDQEFIDLDKALKHEISSIPTVSDMYLETLKEDMEENLLKKAEAMESTDFAKSVELKKVILTFQDAYSYTRQLEYYDNCNKRRFHKDLVRYSRYCSSYNYKNKDSKFKIYDIKLVESALVKVLPQVDLDDIKKFIILLCQVCESLNTEELLDNVFMYFSNSIIINLGYTEIKSDFPKEILANILKVIDAFSMKE